MKFNANTFGNIFKRKGKLISCMKEVHRELEYQVSCNLVRLEKELQENYNETLTQEEIFWFQKSCEKWIKFGNNNTKFFHT